MAHRCRDFFCKPAAADTIISVMLSGFTHEIGAGTHQVG